jgi:hypothetical protein
MPRLAAAKRELPIWVGVVAAVVVLAVSAWFYRGLFLGPPGPDVFGLDPRNPNNVALFRQLDAHYKSHPNEKPSNWPPPQFTDEGIRKAQEQHRKDFAEAEKRRAQVIQKYLEQNKRR